MEESKGRNSDPVKEYRSFKKLTSGMESTQSLERTLEEENEGSDIGLKNQNCPPRAKRMVFLRKPPSKKQYQNIASTIQDEQDQDILQQTSTTPLPRTFQKIPPHMKAFCVAGKDIKMLQKRNILGQMDSFNHIHHQKFPNSNKRRGNQNPKQRMSVIFMHNINHYLVKYNEKKVGQFKQGEPTKEHEAMKLKLEAVKATQEKALVEEKAKLEQLPLSVQLKVTKEERRLSNFQQMQKSWSQQQQFFSRRCNRKQPELTMTQSDLFRSKQESKSVFETQQTPVTKLGQSYWHLTLRKPTEVAGAAYCCHQKLHKNSDLQCTIVTKNNTQDFEQIRSSYGSRNKSSLGGRVTEFDNSNDKTSKKRLQNCYSQQQLMRTRNEIQCQQQVNPAFDYFDVPSESKMQCEVKCFNQTFQKYYEEQMKKWMAAKISNPNTEHTQKNKRFDFNTSTVSPTSKAGFSPAFSKDKGKTSKAIPHYIFESKDPNNDPTEDPKEEDFIDVHYGRNYFY